MALLWMVLGGLLMFVGVMEFFMATKAVCAGCHGKMVATDEIDAGSSVLKAAIEVVAGGVPTGVVKVFRCVNCGGRDTVQVPDWLERVGGLLVAGLGWWLWQ